jgi:hypothetical protein
LFGTVIPKILTLALLAQAGGGGAAAAAAIGAAANPSSAAQVLSAVSSLREPADGASGGGSSGEDAQATFTRVRLKSPLAMFALPPPVSLSPPLQVPGDPRFAAAAALPAPGVSSAAAESGGGGGAVGGEPEDLGALPAAVTAVQVRRARPHTGGGVRGGDRDAKRLTEGMSQGAGERGDHPSRRSDAAAGDIVSPQAGERRRRRRGKTRSPGSAPQQPTSTSAHGTGTAAFPTPALAAGDGPVATRRRRIRIDSTAAAATRSREATAGLSAAGAAAARRAATARAEEATAHAVRRTARPLLAVHRRHAGWDAAPPESPPPLLALPPAACRASARAVLPHVGQSWLLSLSGSFGSSPGPATAAPSAAASAVGGGGSGRRGGGSGCSGGLRLALLDTSWPSESAPPFSPASQRHSPPRGGSAGPPRAGPWVAAERAFHRLPTAVAARPATAGGRPPAGGGGGGGGSRLLCGGALKGVLGACAGLRRERAAFGAWAAAVRCMHRAARRAAR